MNKLIGYVWNHYLGKMKKADIEALDGINIAFGLIKDGEVSWDGAKYLDDIARIKEINPDIKVILSVGGWGAGGFSDASVTNSGRRKLALSIKTIMESSQLDGIDLDWEYPTIPAAGIDARPEDKENFTLLLKEIRETLNEIDSPKYHMLTIATGAGEAYIEATEMDKVAKLCDYVQIMTYDLGEAYINNTGHHTNLYNYDTSSKNSSVDNSVKLFTEAGVPKEKIVIGAAFYARKWTGVKSDGNGFNTVSATCGSDGPKYGELVENYINLNGYTRHWDDQAKAPFLYNGETYLSYDDKESLLAKVEYVKRIGLYGIMYWEHSCDFTLELTRFMSKILKQT